MSLLWFKWERVSTGSCFNSWSPAGDAVLEVCGNFGRWGLEGGSGSLEWWPWVFAVSCFLFWCEGEMWVLNAHSYCYDGLWTKINPSSLKRVWGLPVTEKGLIPVISTPLLSKSSYTVPVFRCDHPPLLNSVCNYSLTPKTSILP